MTVVRSGPLPPQAFTTGLQARVNGAGLLEGVAAPGAIIEVNNLSTLPTGDSVVEDAVEVARAGSDGRFSVQLGGAAPGDVLQVQVRGQGAPSTSTLQLRVDATRAQFDPRAAMVRPERLRLTLDPAGLLTIETRARQPVTEPDAVVRLTNTRTGEYRDVTADVFGRLPPTTIAAQVGDQISVAVSDGSVAIDAANPVASLDVVARGPLVQPAPLLKDGGYVQLLPLNGPLFLEGGPGSGRQGSIGNCPVPAACTALAAIDERAVRELIRANSDGTFTVTFHPPGQRPVEVVVDDQVWGSGQSPRYGTGGRDPRSGKVESWFPLVEKAYAAYVGDYEVLGRGTSVGKVLSELTGRAVREVWTNQRSVDDVWGELARGTRAKLPMAAGTWGTQQQALYRGTGVYANHAYSVLGVTEENGRRLVTLRNPWGWGAAPQGRVGSTDTGVFQMDIADFCKLFQVLNVS